MKPIEHAKSSVRIWGGSYHDYLEIHELLDSSKSAFGDSRHRALTHNSWFITTILERIFGKVITNSENVEVSVRDIGEQHVIEDYRGKFIPTAQDFLQEMELKDWMDNGNGLPPSREKVKEKQLKPITEEEKKNKTFEDLVKEIQKLPPSKFPDQYDINPFDKWPKCGKGLLD